MDFETELESHSPSNRRLKDLVVKARKKGSSYRNAKERIKADSANRLLYLNDAKGKTCPCLISERYGWCYEDNRVEAAVQSMEACLSTINSAKESSFTPRIEPVPGEVLEPWSMPPVDCPEELDTPDPLSFGEDVLHFMEMSGKDARGLRKVPLYPTNSVN